MTDPFSFARSGDTVAAAPKSRDVAALRERAAAIVAELSTPLPEGDHALIEAERRVRELRRRFKSLYGDFDIDSEIEEREIKPHDWLEGLLDDLLETGRPQTLAGAAAMLRYLGREGCEINSAGVMVQNMLALVEREIGGTANCASAHTALLADRGDEQILELFARWKAAWPPLDEAPDNDEASLSGIDALEGQIMAARASGAAGLAIKCFMQARITQGGSYGNPTALCPFDEGRASGLDDRWLKSTMTAAQYFVPELAPMVAEIVAAPDCPPVTDEGAALVDEALPSLPLPELHDDLVFLVPEFGALVGALPLEDDPAIIAWRGYTIMETAVQLSGHYDSLTKERHTAYLRDLMGEAEDLFVTTPATTLAGAYCLARHVISFHAGPEPLGLDENAAATLCKSLATLAGGDCLGDGELEELHRRAEALLAVYDAEFASEDEPPSPAVCAAWWLCGDEHQAMPLWVRLADDTDRAATDDELADFLRKSPGILWTVADGPYRVMSDQPSAAGLADPVLQIEFRRRIAWLRADLAKKLPPCLDAVDDAVDEATDIGDELAEVTATSLTGIKFQLEYLSRLSVDTVPGRQRLCTNAIAAVENMMTHGSSEVVVSPPISDEIGIGIRDAADFEAYLKLIERTIGKEEDLAREVCEHLIVGWKTNLRCAAPSGGAVRV